VLSFSVGYKNGKMADELVRARPTASSLINPPE
jgi:hypothetical protein